MQLSTAQSRVYEYLLGKHETPTFEVGEAVYGKFFNSPKLQHSAANRILKELHKLELVVKHYSYMREDDVWSTKNASNE